ncbi:helix-turn-helix domain-containing protein [Nonomuraea indica]|uniref:helix-turn-helix domain-containing protein n=1 Tax=Nonomuraea indica TaxID=1581193 RepID=UPI000C7D5E6E
MVSQPPHRLPPHFWSAPAVAAALATCDVPALIGEVRRARGWTQTQLAEVIGYSQSWVSKVLRGRQPLTVDQVREVAGRLGIPLHLLRFGERAGERSAARMGRQADETSAVSLMSVTGARRRLEAATPSRELVSGAVAHVELAGSVLHGIDARLADEVRAGLSEAAGFAAWIHGDLLDLGTARVYYRLAVDSARRAGHRLLAAYMLGSRAAFEVEADDPGLALALLAQARRELGDDPPHIARAWLSSIEALAHATGHDAHAARAALRVADVAVTRGERAATPPWPWVFPFDHAKLAGYRAVVSVRLGRAAEAESAFSESLAASPPAAKQHGVLMTEMAAAKAMNGRHDEAFDLAADALRLGVAYGSDRVIQRARRFRRAYAGPITVTVRTFDERLHATTL